MGRVSVDDVKASAVGGAVLVAQSLVRAHSHDAPALFTRCDELARYAVLLAWRMKLSQVDTNRVVLAAWLSVFRDDPDKIKFLAEEHDVSFIVFAAGNRREGTGLGPDILGLVECFQKIVLQSPGLRDDVQQLGSTLAEDWVGTDKDRKRLLECFLQILRDEAFMAGLEATAGRILVVDPNEVITPVMTTPLRNDGYMVRTVRDSLEAGPVIRAFEPDVIISETELPLVGGVALCELVKKNPRTSDIPLLFITSSTDKHIVEQCLKAGAEECLRKPIDLEVLFLKLQRLVKPSAVAAVTGTLKEVAFADMIQVLAAGRRSMVIDFQSGGESGRLDMNEGNIIHASVGQERGAEAVYRMMRWADGSFVARKADLFPERTIQESTTALLMEGARRASEEA